MHEAFRITVGLLRALLLSDAAFCRRRHVRPGLQQCGRRARSPSDMQHSNGAAWRTALSVRNRDVQVVQRECILLYTPNMRLERHGRCDMRNKYTTSNRISSSPSFTVSLICHLHLARQMFDPCFFVSTPISQAHNQQEAITYTHSNSAAHSSAS